MTEDLQARPRTTLLVVGLPGLSVLEEYEKVCEMFESTGDEELVEVTAFVPDGNHWRASIPRRLIGSIGEITQEMFDRGESMRKEAEFRQKAGPLLAGDGQVPPGAFN